MDDPFPQAGIEVRLLGDTGTQSMHNESIRQDDTINVVTLKLGDALGQPVYWWICVPNTHDHDDTIASYESRDRALEALLGPGQSASEDHLARSDFVYMCPHWKACGHAASLPTSLEANNGNRLLEEFDMFDQGSGPVIFVVTKQWLAQRKSEQFALAPSAEDHASHDAVLQRMAGNAARLKYTNIGSINATVTHLLAPGSAVPADGLQTVFDNLVASAQVPMVVLQRLDGTQSTSIWAPKVRERVLTAADVDDITNKMLESGVSSLLYMVSVPFCDALVKVRMYPDLSLDVSVNTRTDMVSRIQEAMDISSTYEIVQQVYNLPVQEVPDDIMDVGLSKIYKRVIMNGTKDISVHSLTKGLDRLAPVVSYTKNENGAVEVYLTRTSGFETPTQIKKIIMKHHDLISKGRIDELNIVVQEATGASQTEVETEIDAYIQHLREVARNGRFSMSHSDTSAVVKAMPHGIVVSLLGTRSIKYTDRLLWCLMNMNQAESKKQAAVLPEDSDDTQAILAMIQSSDEADADSSWDVQEGLDASGAYLSSKYALNRLYTFDKELFTYKKDGFTQYSKMCGAVDKRQPIAVTAERLAQIKETRDISSVTTAKGDAYICPEVWCPATETVMTLEEYKKNGSTCESNKPGIVFTDTKYWSGATDRFVGFLRPDKHPTGMCMPCCFKRDPSANPAGKERLAKCGNAAPDSDADASGSTGKKYVMGATQVPLPPDRRGDLPAGSTLPNSEFVRYGVSQTQDGFMESVAALMAYTSTDKLRATLASAVTVNSVLATGRDGILQRFVDYKNSARKVKEFREHLKTSAGADQMNLTGVKKGLAKLEESDPLFIREMALWDAAERFKQYITSDSVGHSLVLPFLQLVDRTLLIAVVEIVNGEEVIHMPLGGLVDARVARVGVIMRHPGGIYEPVVIRGKGVKAVPEPLPALHPVAANILRLHKRHREVDVKNGIVDLEASVKKRGLEISAHVFNERMLCVGVVLAGGLFVPTGVPDGTTVRGIKRVVYVDNILHEASEAIASDDAKATLASLDLEHLAVDRVDEVKGKGGDVIALRVLDYYVPLRNAPELPTLFSGYDDAISHFLKSPPLHTDGMKARFRNKEALLKMYDAMIHHLRTNHVSELFVLTHPLCPYPMNKRADMMTELVSPVASEPRDSIAKNAIRMILTKQRRLASATSSSSESSDIIRANEDDVIDGTLVSVVTTASRALEYLHVVRKVFRESARHSNDKIRAAFARHVTPAAIPDMQFYETNQTGTDVVYAMGVAAHRAGKKQNTSVYDYVSDVVDHVISEYELRGEAAFNKKLHLNPKVLEHVRAELTVPRPGLDKRLKTALTRPGMFFVGAGDAARFLSMVDLVAVVYSDFAPPVVEGSGERAVVGFVSKEGNLALALTTADDGTTCVHDTSALPKHVQNTIRNV
jgi:hypothetical protein